MNVLSVGSSLIDLFVDLNQNSQVSLQNDKVTLNLGDKIPVGIKALSLGGNSGNVAAGIKKLGIDSTLYTYLGNDALSNFISQTVQNEGVKLIVENTQGQTGSLSIILSIADDRTILSHHNFSNHSFDSSKIEVKPDLIYLTSIGEEWEDAYRKVVTYAVENNIGIALSPGSHQLIEMNEVFLDAVHKSKMLFCNLEEAKKICKWLSGLEIQDPKEILSKITEFGFELLSVTDGENGSYALTDKDSTTYRIDTLKSTGNEKTGAGDAYAAAFLATYLINQPLEECMKRGVLNALGVMSNVGAHTGQLTLEEIERKSAETELTAFKI